MFHKIFTYLGNKKSRSKQNPFKSLVTTKVFLVTNRQTARGLNYLFAKKELKCFLDYNSFPLIFLCCYNVVIISRRSSGSTYSFNVVAIIHEENIFLFIKCDNDIDGHQRSTFDKVFLCLTVFNGSI